MTMQGPQRVLLAPEAERAKLELRTERWLKAAGADLAVPAQEPDGSFIPSARADAAWTIDNGPAVPQPLKGYEHEITLRAREEARAELQAIQEENRRRSVRYGRVTLAKLGRRMCRSVDQAESGEWFYCGRPQQDCSVYCQRHHAVYYRGRLHRATADRS